MKCPKCQFENREGVKFCEKCGGGLELACPNCGTHIPSDREFCGQCGHDLRASKAAPAIDYSQPQSYTPKFLADKILTSRGTIEGERKLVTVLFADVANYTSISEKLDLEEVHQIMDGCFKVLMDEIHRYEGTIDKFTGDGVMALFGAPVAHEYHAQRACYAALAIQRALEGYGEKIEKECGVEFKMRVGLNSGPVLVDSVGNDLRMDYTAIGDTVNLASRMESMATPGKVLVSADTHKMARDFFRFKPLGKVSVKGKEELVEAYELVEAGEVETRFEAAVAKGLTKFVGREKEITSLEEAFEKAKLGSGQFVGIVGEAGVGKSRILLELRGMLPQEEYTYLEGRCLHYGGSMAYLPFLDILKSYFDIKEGEREPVIKKKIEEKIFKLDEKLKGILPPLHDILSLKVEDEEYLKLEPQQRRVKTFEAIRDLLLQESRDRPLIVAIEDLHWVDRTSEEFLSYLIGWLANARIQMILLYRLEYTHPWGSKSYYSQINVDQLSARASAELVQSILEGGEVVPELRELIIARAGGNPLFVEEFTHTLLENGSIKKKEHQYVLSTKASDIQVPDTIQGIIAARMDRLEDNLKRTMQVASVIGRDFAFRVLNTITGMQEELKSYLLDLQGLEFIYEKSLFPELEYIFKHALTQEVAYNSLLLKRRRELHERIGKAIEELYPDTLEEFYEVLAHHYLRSSNADKAYTYLKHSGDKAIRSYSLSEAFRHYREAMNVLDKLPDTKSNKQRGIAIRLSTLSPMLNLVYPEDSLQIMQDGASLSSELGDIKSLAIFNSRIGSYYAYQSDTCKGVDYCEDSFRSALAMDEVEIAAPTAVQLCSSYSVIGNFQQLVQVAREAIAMIESKERESDYFGTILNMYSGLCGQCGHALAIMGHFNEGISLCEKGLNHAHQMGNLYGIAIGEFNYGLLFIHRGDGKRASHHLKESMQIQEKSQVILVLGLTWTLIGRAYNMLGELRQAHECMEKGLKLQKEAGLSAYLSFHYCFLSSLQIDLGLLDHARQSVDKALELSRNNNEGVIEGIASIIMGKVLTEEEKVPSSESEKYILNGIKILNERKIEPYATQGLLFLGELHTKRENQQKALEYLSNAEKKFEELGMEYWLAKARNLAWHLKR